MRWLFKEEPDHYSYDALARDRKTVWSGVRNPLAQKHLRSVRKGDLIFYYHTGKEKAVVGLARAVSDPYPDPKRRPVRSSPSTWRQSGSWRTRSHWPRSRPRARSPPCRWSACLDCR